jgi:hypothetical protein
MMPSSPIQHRTEARHFGRLSPCLRRSATLHRDRTANPVEQRAIRSFAPTRPPKIELKQSDRQRRPNFPNTHVDAKSP